MRLCRPRCKQAAVAPEVIAPDASLAFAPPPQDEGNLSAGRSAVDMPNGAFTKGRSRTTAVQARSSEGDMPRLP